MLRKSIYMQGRVMLSRKNVIFTFSLMLLMILINYFINVFTYSGRDIINMYHPMKLLTLANDSGAIGFYFMHFFPIVVVIPTGFSLMLDKNSREMIFIQSRIGTKSYYLGKMIVAFLITFAIFTIPFLIEIVLNYIAFPCEAVGDPSNMNLYEGLYIEGVRNYFLYPLYIKSVYVYTILFTVFFGMISGILAMFTVAISIFPIKYKIYLFLPVYILLYAISLLGELFSQINISTSYYVYLRIFNNDVKDSIAYISIIIGILMISSVLCIYKGRKDCLE